MSQQRARWRRLLILGTFFALVLVGAVAVWPTMRVTNYLTDARRALSLGDTEAALASLEVAERVGRRRAAVQYLIGVAKRRDGRVGEGVVHLQTAADLGWNAQDIERQLWLAAAQRGELPEVKRQLTQAVQSDVSDEAAEEIYEAFTKGCLSTYQLHDAWMCLDIWLQWRPEARQARFLRASIHEQLGDYREACEDYRTVLESSPHHHEARTRLAQALMILQDYDDARLEFQALLAINPDDVDALIGLAQCARRAGETADARQHVDRVLSQSLTGQQRGTALGELGRILLDDGQASEALELLRQAVAIAPGDAGIHHALGTALARTGNADEAAFHHARMQHLRKQFDTITEITRRLATEPGNADLRCEAGAIMMDAGLKKEGADWLQTALRCDPGHRRTHELLASYYTETGDHSLAGRHRLLAARPAPDPPLDAASEVSDTSSHVETSQ